MSWSWCWLWTSLCGYGNVFGSSLKQGLRIVGSKGSRKEYLVNRGPADVPAVQRDAHALCVQGDDVVPHCLEHVAIQLIHPSSCGEQVPQCDDLMAMPLAQQHVVA